MEYTLLISAGDCVVGSVNAVMVPGITLVALALKCEKMGQRTVE